MIDLPFASLAAALMAAATPWIVVRVALSVALRGEGTASQPTTRPALTWGLGATTALAAVALVVAAFVLPLRQTSLAAAGLASFALLSLAALRALRDIDAATRAGREVAATQRVASLEPRRVVRYLPWAWRALPWGIAAAGLGTFVGRLAAPAGDRRLLAPVAFAVAAAVLAWLYQVWIQELVTGPRITGGDGADAGTARAARALLAVQVTLVSVCVAVAHVLLDLDRTAHPLGAATALLAGGLCGIVGCALAIASPFGRRRYAPAEEVRRARGGEDVHVP